MVQPQVQDPLAELGLAGMPQGMPRGGMESFIQAFPGTDPAQMAAPPEQDPVMMPMPPEVVDEDVVQAFWAQHGRAPTARDMQLAHGGAQLEVRMGRPPTRAELLDFLDGRDLTIPAQPAQFTIDTGQEDQGVPPYGQ